MVGEVGGNVVGDCGGDNVGFDMDGAVGDAVGDVSDFVGGTVGDNVYVFNLKWAPVLLNGTAICRRFRILAGGSV